MSSNSSRLGVRGTEALGGGLSAIFQIESASARTPAAACSRWTRETFVGLQGSWGTFKMGYFLAPYDDIHPIFGNVPTLTTSILSTAALWAQGSQTTGQRRLRRPLGNSIRYDSPRIGGFTGLRSSCRVRLAPDAACERHAFGTRRTSQASRLRLSTGGFYTNGPFQAGIAYEAQQQGSWPDAATTGRSRSPPTGTSASSRSAACTSVSTTTSTGRRA